jgi:peroxiredoxin family protein
MNSSEHPLKKDDYTSLSRDKDLFFYKPQFDDEYSDEDELSNLIGDRAYLKGYFFTKKGIESLKTMGYEVEIDTLDAQNERIRLQKIDQEKRRNRQRLFETIFLFIEKNGIYLQGENYLNGEEIESPSSSDAQLRIYGGSKWITIEEGKKRIWSVTNNGGDGDCWAWNNVVTGGAGGIGRVIPYNEYIANKIRNTKKDYKILTEDDCSFKESDISNLSEIIQIHKDDLEQQRKEQEEREKKEVESLIANPTFDVVCLLCAQDGVSINIPYFSSENVKLKLIEAFKAERDKIIDRFINSHPENNRSIETNYESYGHFTHNIKNVLEHLRIISEIEKILGSRMEEKKIKKEMEQKRVEEEKRKQNELNNLRNKKYEEEFKKIQDTFTLELKNLKKDELIQKYKGKTSSFNNSWNKDKIIERISYSLTYDFFKTHPFQF